MIFTLTEDNMSDFVICTDSAADLPQDYIQKHNIKIIPFYITLDGVNYLKENVDLSHNDFYNKLNEGIMPKTSCPSINDYTDVFKEVIERGCNVICFCLSSKLSGSYQSAFNAAAEFNENEQRVFVVDSQLATAAQGLLINECVRMREDKLDVQTAFDKINELKLTGGVNFVIDDLTYLQKGGRIGKVSALMGTILNIKPIIELKNGELLPLGKVRGRKKAAAEIKKITADIIKNYGDTYAYTILNFAQIGDIDDFTSSVDMTMKAYCIGSTIGSHVGTSAAGIAYIKKYK